MSNTKKHVVIVGGGFGGVKAAEELSRNENLQITLVSDRPDFWYFPSLYHTATGASRTLSSIPLTRLIQNKPVELIIAKAEKLDRVNKRITLADGQIAAYDELVLALGVVTNYFGIKGLDRFSYGVKSIEDAEKLKAHLHQQLLDDKKPDLNYVVVGGGATGIELAAQLPSYLHQIMKRHNLPRRRIHIDLVEAAPHLLPRGPKKVGRTIERRLRKLGIRLYLGKKVEGETADALVVNGKPIMSHTVIWTAGQANNPFFAENGFTLTEHHKVAVNEYMEAEPHIYVIGDNADTPFSGMAQTAVYDAEFVAHDLRFQLADRPRVHYRPKKPVYVTPAGPHWAAVEWGKMIIFGWLGWILRGAADIKAFSEIESPLQASEQWLKEFRSDTAICPTCTPKS